MRHLPIRTASAFLQHLVALAHRCSLDFTRYGVAASPEATPHQHSTRFPGAQLTTGAYTPPLELLHSGRLLSLARRAVTEHSCGMWPAVHPVASQPLPKITHHHRCSIISTVLLRAPDHLISTALISPAHSRLLRRTYCFYKRCISAGCPHSHSKQSLNAPTPAACSPQCLLSHRSIPRGSITSAQHACPRSSPPPLRISAPRSFSRTSSCTACFTGPLASCVPLADVCAGCHDKPQRPTAEAHTCVHILQAWHSNGRPASCVALQLQRACLLRMHPPTALFPL